MPGAPLRDVAEEAAERERFADLCTELEDKREALRAAEARQAVLERELAERPDVAGAPPLPPPRRLPFLSLLHRAALHLEDTAGSTSPCSSSDVEETGAPLPYCPAGDPALALERAERRASEEARACTDLRRRCARLSAALDGALAELRKAGERIEEREGVHRSPDPYAVPSPVLPFCSSVPPLTPAGERDGGQRALRECCERYRAERDDARQRIRAFVAVARALLRWLLVLALRRGDPCGGAALLDAAAELAALLRRGAASPRWMKSPSPPVLHPSSGGAGADECALAAAAVDFARRVRAQPDGDYPSSPGGDKCIAPPPFSPYGCLAP